MLCISPFQSEIVHFLCSLFLSVGRWTDRHSPSRLESLLYTE